MKANKSQGYAARQMDRQPLRAYLLPLWTCLFSPPGSSLVNLNLAAEWQNGLGPLKRLAHLLTVPQPTACNISSAGHEHIRCAKLLQGLRQITQTGPSGVNFLSRNTTED